MNKIVDVGDKFIKDNSAGQVKRDWEDEEEIARIAEEAENERWLKAFTQGSRPSSVTRNMDSCIDLAGKGKDDSTVTITSTPSGGSSFYEMYKAAGSGARSDGFVSASNLPKDSSSSWCSDGVAPKMSTDNFFDAACKSINEADMPCPPDGPFVTSTTTSNHIEQEAAESRLRIARLEQELAMLAKPKKVNTFEEYVLQQKGKKSNIMCSECKHRQWVISASNMCVKCEQCGYDVPEEVFNHFNIF